MKRSVVAVAVLALLAEKPMHPYEMQRLIRERGKERVINVTWRTSLYKTIDRLADAGLVATVGTERAGGRPERTVYEITDDGRETVRTWLRGMLTAPREDFPEFTAAIAYLPLLDAGEVRSCLAGRLAALERDLADIHESKAAGARLGLPRLVLLEEELREATVRAHIDWITGVVADLDAGRLRWTAEELAAFSAELERER
ncbi:PadR family transcriptional regulator [Amycolatopsis suaedae]|uniref:PadR family transcriptional regulator n=1 Tax=Amycolatopsis suaedae TaxID=2510978 RepID=A0A4Q7J8E1_9PSEU|nr:PadR family transcriptional regulator [Amycolatopsis suaedae]RZQ63102.1 PadR family transcriptional regulator [Amycolatopsis suaedae]